MKWELTDSKRPEMGAFLMPIFGQRTQHQQMTMGFDSFSTAFVVSSFQRSQSVVAYGAGGTAIDGVIDVIYKRCVHCGEREALFCKMNYV